jgi:hypothetical protein
MISLRTRSGSAGSADGSCAVRSKQICQFSYIGSRLRFSPVLAKVGCRQLLVNKFEVFEKFGIPKRIWLRHHRPFVASRPGERTQVMITCGSRVDAITRTEFLSASVIESFRSRLKASAIKRPVSGVLSATNTRRVLRLT